MDIATYFIAEPDHFQAIMAPDHKRASIILREVTNRLLSIPGMEASLRIASEPVPLIEYNRASGHVGHIYCFSLHDPDSPRGFKFHRALVDEAAMIPDQVVDDSIMPTLADFNGQLTAVSTPRGQNWFFRQFALGLDPKQRHLFYSTQLPSTANPYLSAEFLENMRLLKPERTWNQEFLAKFLADAGGVFRGVDGAVDPGRKMELPKRGVQYTLGWDLARLEDFTVISVVEVATGRQVWFERFNLMAWERQIERVATVCRLFNNAACIMDSTGMGGDVLYEAIRKKGVYVTPYTLNNQSKEQLIDNLAMLIENGKIRLLDDAVQTNELKTFEYQTLPSGKLRMAAPSGYHDDCVIALAMSAWGLAPMGGWWKDTETMNYLIGAGNPEVDIEKDARMLSNMMEELTSMQNDWRVG